MAEKNIKDKTGTGKVESKPEDAPAGEDSKKKEEEMLRQLQEEIDRLTTKDIITQMMMSLSSLAYKKMGIPAEANNKYKDKEQAKMAVDSFDALFKVLKDELSASEVENLQSSLANLQLNFVKVFP
jgi:predicted RNase H-like nuclease (RuvC/YqgF family)